jgi:hypothetical protein
VETFSRGTLAPTYVTGFVDAAGSFTYSRSSKQLALYFALKVPAADRPLLEEVQAFFGGIGRIYAEAYFRVTRREELMAVVEHFDAYPLRSTKGAIYDLWREMVIAKQEFRRPDRERLSQLADEISRRR